MARGAPAAIGGRFDTDPTACTGSVPLALALLEQPGSGVAAGCSGSPRNQTDHFREENNPPASTQGQYVAHEVLHPWPAGHWNRSSEKYHSPLLSHSTLNSGVLGQPEALLGEPSVCHRTAMPTLSKLITNLSANQVPEPGLRW